MKKTCVRAFIQARMSSRRFPGKVLAPFLGRPIVAHVVSCVCGVVPRSRVVVLTSDEPSDDPLASYAETLGVGVFRGPLDDVFGRFRACLRRHPCDFFLRICADSPLLSPSVIRAVAAAGRAAGADLATNVFPRTFPKGQSAELLRAGTFLAVDQRRLTGYQREHVTPFFYENPGRFSIVNVESGRPSLSRVRMDVSEPADLPRLEAACPRGVVGLPSWVPAGVRVLAGGKR
ncbi:MAG: NTP transferase domain-containing protein [Elusimicrobiota bacterium]